MCFWHFDCVGLQEAEKLRHLAEEDRAAALAERDEALAAKEAAELERQEVRSCSF